ncbi:unnamed protein product, partial [Effrenium voratum]
VLPPLKSFKSYCELAKTPPGLSRPGNLAPLDSEVPTAKLLKDFMHFYRHFDWRNEMINAISGERGRPIFEAQDAVLFLQDPFRPLCNLGSRCTEPSFQRIKEELKRGSDLCSENLGAAGLFEPWAPGWIVCFEALVKIKISKTAMSTPPARRLVSRLSRGWRLTRRRFSTAPSVQLGGLESTCQDAQSSFLDSGQDVLEAAKEEEAFEEPEKPSVASARGVLWVANVYPTKAFRLDFRQMLTHHNHETLIPKLLPAGVKVEKMVPREREGGAFVYFSAPKDFVREVLRTDIEASKKRFASKGEILRKVSEGISNYLKTHNFNAFLCPSPVRAHRVKGTPYLEETSPAGTPPLRSRFALSPHRRRRCRRRAAVRGAPALRPAGGSARHGGQLLQCLLPAHCRGRGGPQLPPPGAHGGRWAILPHRVQAVHAEAGSGRRSTPTRAWSFRSSRSSCLGPPTSFGTPCARPSWA